MIGFGERFTSWLWAAGCITASAAVIALTVALCVAAAERKALRSSIDAPVTGYVARLARCEANLATVGEAVDEQNAAVEAYRADSDRRLAEAQKAVESARAAGQAARTQAVVILAGKGSGDLCRSAERVLRGDEG